MNESMKELQDKEDEQDVMKMIKERMNSRKREILMVK